jgi:hypothetical protein
MVVAWGEVTEDGGLARAAEQDPAGHGIELTEEA